MNDPREVRRITEEARIMAGKPRAQPPGLSPEKPKRRGQQLYSEQQVAEAIKLAATVGVPMAEEMTGVNRWTIYRVAGRERKKKKLVPIDTPKNPRMRSFMSAARLALYWHMNLRQVKPAPRLKRDCFDRAADKFQIKRADLWTAYITNQIDGITYDAKSP